MRHHLLCSIAAVVALAVPVVAQAPAPYDRPPKYATGATNPDITSKAQVAATICNPKWSTKHIRPPASMTTKLKKMQMAQLGYTVKNPLPRMKTKSGKGTRPNLTKCVARSANPACFEEDHLISLEIGGCPDCPSNLWPEPWFGVWNAHRKDVLENTLHRLVCRGEVELEEAQQAIATDWVAAYQQYVATTKDQPSTTTTTTRSPR